MTMIDHNPKTNEKAISIIEQPDGNWIGYMQRFGNLVEVRDGRPDVVLARLLSHDGQTH